MNIYIPIEMMFFYAVIFGLVIGYFMAWLSLKPPRPKKEVDVYDGLHGQGYQPLANQAQRAQRPKPPQSEMTPMKPPKKVKSVYFECGNNDKIPARKRPAPPKPRHPKR